MEGITVTSKNVSKLSEHKFKKGIIVSPFNNSFGEMLKLNSWARDRLPEYVWLGLILNKYGRKEGLKKAESILWQLAQIDIELTQPKISKILNLSLDKQEKVFKIICNYIDPNVLAPLTIVFRTKENDLFSKYFYDRAQTVDQRISVIKDIIRKCFDHQSNQATDLRYLCIGFLFFKGKVHATGMTVEAIKNYSKTDHKDEKMKIYRPSIRSFEGLGMDIDETNANFISYFWEELGLVTDCSPHYIKFTQHKEELVESFLDTKKVIENIIVLNKSKLLEDAKFNVLIGSMIYILKIADEVLNKELENAILGRHALRTILEVYIMMKYLVLKEKDRNNIFEDYQVYGVGKYKHILLRVRESSIINEQSHIVVPLLESIVNEPMWEEFMNIDVRFFDQQNIKKKFEEVNEKELYETYYEYGTNYAHGFWGAVRESSLLFCDNPLHKYHSVPDIYFKQKLTSVAFDIDRILKLYIQLLSKTYEFPTWYKSKYEGIEYGI